MGTFVQLGEIQELEKNQSLHHAGEIVESCYYVRSGELVAFEYTVSGAERVFSVIHPGELILLPSMVTTRRVTLNFKAVLPSELIKIHRDMLFQAMAEDTEIAVQMVQSLSMRLIASIEYSRKRDNYSVPWRVCSFLIDAAERSGSGSNGGLLNGEKVSRQGIANALHVNRVTVARIIRDLKANNLVEYINGFYFIQNVEKLKKHMRYLETHK